MHLPIDEFDAYLGEVIRMLEREAKAMGGAGGGGPVDHRAHVEREMRRLHG